MSSANPHPPPKIVQGIIPSTSKMDKGISAYKDGGMIHSSLEPLVSSLT